MRVIAGLVLAICAATIVACGDSPPAAADTKEKGALGPGEGKLTVDGGEIWYKVSGVGTGIPVILVHGPGVNSYPLKPLEQLGDDRKVVRYDQLGSGKSGALTDTSKMDIAHLVGELEALRAKLGFNKVHVLGHAWGALLALEYYRAHPEHVVSLTLSSPALDAQQWERHARELLKTLPDTMQRIVKHAEEAKKFDTPEYQATLRDFYMQYVSLRPARVDFDSTVKQMNDKVYNHMLGPSEFAITGTLKKYNATEYLRNVNVSTLFTVGDQDQADTTTIKKLSALTPGSTVIIIPQAANMTMWDNPFALTDVIRTHLRFADLREKLRAEDSAASRKKA